MVFPVISPYLPSKTSCTFEALTLIISPLISGAFSSSPSVVVSPPPILGSVIIISPSTRDSSAIITFAIKVLSLMFPFIWPPVTLSVA